MRSGKRARGHCASERKPVPPKPPLKPVPSAPTDDGASIAHDDRMTLSGEISQDAADAPSRRQSPMADVACQAESCFPMADVACQTKSCFRVSARDWPLSFIQGEQAKDEVLAELARLLTEGNCPPRHSVSGGVKPWLQHWSRLRLLDGVLFKVYRSRPRAPESLQVIIPRGLIAGVLTSLHAGPCGGHFGCEKLLKQVQSRFFWVGMCDDVDAFCKECDRCAGRNSPSPKPRAAMGELYSSEPWEIVSTDFMNDLPLTDRGNNKRVRPAGNSRTQEGGAVTPYTFQLILLGELVYLNVDLFTIQGTTIGHFVLQTFSF